MASVDYKRELNDLVGIVVAEKASDIHFSAGSHPMIRVSGSLLPLLKKPILTPEDIEGFIKVLLREEQFMRYVEKKETDFSFQHESSARFRGNAFFQKGSMSVVLRLISEKIKTIAELGLPPILESFAMRPQGFFLCVGPVGQGKSTTLAAMIELINQNKADHIVTIEDPIEYIYEPKQSLIDQREVNIDTENFATALKASLRQDVDVILVGEMRDPETISTAVTAAETGHLVFSTLHTNNAAQTIDRIIDSSPAGQQEQVRMQLAGSLAGIFSQRLIPSINGGQVPAYELLVNNSAVSNLIREGRTHEVQTIIETGLEQGMVDMNRSLLTLVKSGEITTDNAFAHAFNPKGLERLL